MCRVWGRRGPPNSSDLRGPLPLPCHAARITIRYHGWCCCSRYSWLMTRLITFRTSHSASSPQVHRLVNKSREGCDRRSSCWGPAVQVAFPRLNTTRQKTHLKTHSVRGAAGCRCITADCWEDAAHLKTPCGVFSKVSVCIQSGAEKYSGWLSRVKPV